ncbi:hypothetical protein [Dactylosporangium darangshiense]|uniref:hypothetical protein n=1 Tax=Dactylosporangium darangshiense TaxID=579108 RepID=UPI0031F0F6C9
MLVLLYHQFARDRAAWPGLVLSGALLVWWFIRPWPARDAAGVAWIARGLVLAAAAAYYGMAGLDRPRLDPVLAAFAAALIAAGVLQRPDPGFPRGRRLVATIAYLVAALAGRYLGYWLALALFWVPARALGLLRDWWAANWLVFPVAALVWLLWAIVIGLGLGVLQSYEVRRRRVTHGQSYTYGSAPPLMGTGSYSYTTHTNTYEQSEEEELTRPPLGTGLVPLVQVRWVAGGWTSSTSSHGGWGSAMSTTYADGHWRVRAFHFPPVYLPIWLNRLVQAGSSRRGRATGEQDPDI